MNSIISDLYHGELHPNEHDYSDSAQADVLLGSFKQNEKWLTEMLDGKAKEHLLELINIHDELNGFTSYHSFREGFILGASLIMEICRGTHQSDV